MPLTAVTPIGSRLLPPLSNARAAPASMVTEPLLRRSELRRLTDEGVQVLEGTEEHVVGDVVELEHSSTAHVSGHATRQQLVDAGEAALVTPSCDGEVHVNF